MSIIERIKRERVMDFGHWRYRLLHWAFNENCTTPEESRLPKFFYTHYCPLFHITNILAILIPIIITFKLFFVFFNIIKLPVLYAIDYIKNRIQNHVNSPEFKLRQLNYKVSMHKERIYNYYVKRGYEATLKDIYNDGDLMILDPPYNDIKYWTEYLDKIHEDYKITEEERKERAEKFVFWIRFSEIFVKGCTLTLIAVACVILWYFLCFAIPGMWNLFIMFLGFLGSINLVGLFQFLLTVISIVVIALFLPFIVNMLADKFGKVFTTPASIIHQILHSAFEWIKDAADFVEELYENSCPPIKIREKE